MIHTFILHWTDGKDETVVGDGETQHKALQNAFTNAGYGGSALIALDYWEEVSKVPTPLVIVGDENNGAAA